MWNTARQAGRQTDTNKLRFSIRVPWDKTKQMCQLLRMQNLNSEIHLYFTNTCTCESHKCMCWWNKSELKQYAQYNNGKIKLWEFNCVVQWSSSNTLAYTAISIFNMKQAGGWCGFIYRSCGRISTTFHTTTLGSIYLTPSFCLIHPKDANCNACQNTETASTHNVTRQ